MTSATRPVDILAMEQDQAANMLGMHLDSRCPGKSHSDNLISWTSSLLFAIQYAIFRGWRDSRSPSEVMICVIETAKFPQAQFARDTWLIEAHQSESSTNLAAQDFFRFRLERDEYYNREYLS